MSPATNRVLIIDDDTAVRQTLTMIAEASGYSAIGADSSARLCAEGLLSCDPTVVLLDLQMPERDGIQVLADLAECGCRAPVVLASGADRRTLDASMRLGRERGLNMAG